MMTKLGERRSYTELEHTGEVRLRIVAPTRELLFAEAARALRSVLAGDDGVVAGAEIIHNVEVTARDLAGLLVEWLNELVFFAETSGVVVTSCNVESLSETALRARVSGRPPRAWKTAVKAATYHELAVHAVEGGFAASVVLDV